MFYFKEKFLNDEECSRLIDLYLKNLDKVFQYRNTFPLKLESNDICVENIHKRVIELCNALSDTQIKLDNCEIVRWPSGSFQEPHYDGDDVFAVVIYLNDDFGGGRTVFKFDTDIKVKPETGKCLIFSNSKYLHWVEEVEKSDRYTLAYWFVRS